MRLIEISSLKLFCCKLVSHKMFCCKNFCHKNVARKAKKFPARGKPRAGKKKKRAGHGGWPCHAPPCCTRRWAAWPLAAPRPPAPADKRRQARNFFFLLYFFTLIFFFFFVFVYFFAFFVTFASVWL